MKGDQPNHQVAQGTNPTQRKDQLLALLISKQYIRSRYESTTDTRHTVYPRER